MFYGTPDTKLVLVVILINLLLHRPMHRHTVILKMESILMSYSRLFKANLVVKANWLSVAGCGTRSISIKSCLMNEDRESDGDEKPAKDKTKQNKDAKSPSLKAKTETKNVKPVKVYAKKEEVAPAISSTIISQILSMNITSKKNQDGQPIDLNLARPRNKRQERSEIKQAKMEIQKEAPGLSIDLIQATKEVANVVGGDVEKTKSELLTKLLEDSTEASAKKLGDLLSGMKVDNEDKLKGGKQGYSEITQAKPFHLRSTSKNDIFGGKRLFIFTKKDYQSEKQILPTWEILNKRELELSVTHPPKNAFEEEIQWLKQGKSWQFPIDNEQGLDNEKQFGFNDHVFLEPLISDFPKTGPLRQFMELVLYGLSKNPYITVHAKRESIEWFRQYFKDKAVVLQEQGVQNVQLSTS